MENYRTSKIEEALNKLADISGSINKLIAVHEQRINVQDKKLDSLDTVIEKRREENSTNIKEIYETIRSEDKNIINEITKVRSEQLTHYEKLSIRINEIEKRVWMYIGASGIIAFILMYGPTIFKLFFTKL